MAINPQTGEYDYQRVFNFKVKISKVPLLSKKKCIAEDSVVKKLFWKGQNMSKPSNFANHRNSSYSPSPNAKNPSHHTSLHLNDGFYKNECLKSKGKGPAQTIMQKSDHH
jgi:hypothetical protein